MFQVEVFGTEFLQFLRKFTSLINIGSDTSKLIGWLFRKFLEEFSIETYIVYGVHIMDNKEGYNVGYVDFVWTYANNTKDRGYLQVQFLQTHNMSVNIS